MSSSVANLSKAAAMVLCAGAGCAFAGPAGAGAGSLLGGLIGGLLTGAAGNFAHQLLDGFAGFFGASMSRPGANAPNHDLTILAATAIRDTLSAAAGQLGPYEPKFGAAKRIAMATPEQIAAALASVPDDAFDEASILAIIGTPLGGITTPIKTPAFWTFIAKDLAKKTDAHTRPPTRWGRLIAAVTSLFAANVKPASIDPHAPAAIEFVAGFLHRCVANQTNDLLRGSSELCARARHAAMFAFLRAILDAVRAPGSGVTMTDALRDAIKDAMATATADLSKEPKWFTQANQSFASSLTTHAEAIAKRLADLGTDTTALKTSLAGLVALIHDEHAPHLTLPAASLDKSRDRFVFRTERLTVVGRDDELKELKDWLDKPDGFGWDLWVGPAGSGKSRLALELFRQRADWRGGFFSFNDSHKPDWLLWQPTANTLIVFDYVAEHAREIGTIVATLTARAVGGVGGADHPLPAGVKVRCLLLERAALRESTETGSAPALAAAAPAAATTLEAPWLSVLRTAAKATGAQVSETFARGDLNHAGRYVAGVSLEASAAICKEEAALANDALTREQFIPRIECAWRIDRHLRPLFVAMAAEAHRKKAGDFNFAQLVEYIRDKEWAHACERLDTHKDGKGADHAAWAKLVCLATMCEGLTGTRLKDALTPSRSLGLPDLNAYDDGSRYALLVSGASSEDAPKLEPDIVGEAMVLHWLEKLPHHRDALIALAWRLGMDGFVARCAQNFPQVTEKSGLLNPSPHAVPSALAAAHTTLGGRDFDSGDIAGLARRGQSLLVDSAQPALVRALGGFMWMQEKADPPTLDEFLANIRTIGPADRADAAVREPLANGLNNAIAHAGADAVRSDPLLAELRGLAQAHPDDAAVQMAAFRGCGAAFLRAVEDGRSDVASVENTTALVPGLPVNQESYDLAVMLARLVHLEAAKADGDAKAALDRAHAALVAAIQSRFGSPDAKVTDSGPPS